MFLMHYFLYFFSQNNEWIISTSGGCGSLYSTRHRKNRERSFPYNNVSFVNFDRYDNPQGIIFGLQNGTIEINAKETIVFRDVHEARILCVAKKKNIIASICAKGYVKVFIKKKKKP